MSVAKRKTVPKPLPTTPFSIPHPHRTVFQNGLRVIIFEEKRLPLVNYRLAFLAGDAADPRDAVGTTSAMASMLTEGTENYSSRQLAESIERLGGNLSASSSDDFTIISASALSMYAADILRLIEEIVFRPTFPEHELDLYRRNTIENLKFQRSQPSFLAAEQVARVLYGGHPYAVTSPTPTDIERLTRNSLVDFHKRSLIPNNAILIVVGDVDHSDFLKDFEDRFGAWPRSGIPVFEMPPPPTRDTRKLLIVDRPGSAQANIVLADLAFERNSPDYFPALVMNQILGAGASSRVFMNLREDKGYTYGAYTRIDAKRFAGSLEATTEVRTQVTAESIKELLYELARIREEHVPDEELSDAKGYLIGVFPIRAETQEGLTNLILNQQLYGLPDDYLQTYRDRVNAVTTEDVLRVARRYIRPDHMAIVIVGDGVEVLRQARPLADDIQVCDTEGKRKELCAYSTDGEPANLGGHWNLRLDFQGEQIPVDLYVDQKGSMFTGRLETVLGKGEIREGAIEGQRLSARAVTEFQGTSLDIQMAGAVDGDTITGTMLSALSPEALTFSGTREREDR